MKKNVVILGSTGSIGQNALRVVAALPDRLRVIGLSAGRNYRGLLQQAARFRVRHLALADAEAAAACAAAAPRGVRVLAGPEGVAALASLEEAHIVLCAIVGMAGLAPVLAAVACGRPVALATKEVLVAAGALIMRACRRHGARLLPVDSEHSALFQCLEGHDVQSVRRLLLTASGGPFAAREGVDFRKVTVAEALRHPRWNMGRKVTVDSATLMNKGLEILEARWLFGVPLDRIDVLIHPESIVHSLVEFRDGSVLAQLSPPDMRFAIQYALTWPERVDGGLPPLNLTRLGALHFHAPDPRRFPCLRLAREAAATGGTMPAVLNAANEIAVESFLQGRIRFCDIARIVQSVMRRHRSQPALSVEVIRAADAWARREAARLCGGRPRKERI